MAGNKILNAPSGQNSSLAGTEAFPVTGSQYVLISTLVAFALASPTITGHATIEGVTLTGATGTGKLVFDHTPTLVTPVLGVATATSINKVILTAPATGSTLTIADGKTLTVSNSLTLAGTDATTMTFPSTNATIARTDAAQTFTGVQTFSTPIATGSVATMTATVGGGVPTPPNNTTTFLRGDGTFAAPTGTTPGGSNTQIQYNNSSAFGGISTFTTDGTNITLTSGTLTLSSSPIVLSGNISAPTWGGAAIANITGVRIKGVSATMTDTTAATGTTAVSATDILGGNTIAATNTGVVFTNYYGMYLKAPVAGANVTLTNAWAFGADNIQIVSGGNLTILGGNLTNNRALKMANGSSGINFLLNNAGFNAVIEDGNSNDFLALSSNQIGIGPQLAFNAAAFANGGGDISLLRISAANLRQGFAASASPTAQIFTLGEASRGGTDTNVAGANGTLQSGLGTGTGTVSSLIFQTPTVAASGTTAQTYATRLTLTSAAATFAPAVVHSLPENLKAYTVATLPAGNPGDYAYVTDDTLSTWNSTLTGGSTGYTPVFKNATVWVSI